MAQPSSDLPAHNGQVRRTMSLNQFTVDKYLLATRFLAQGPGDPDAWWLVGHFSSHWPRASASCPFAPLIFMVQGEHTFRQLRPRQSLGNPAAIEARAAVLLPSWPCLACSYLPGSALGPTPSSGLNLSVMLTLAQHLNLSVPSRLSA